VDPEELLPIARGSFEHGARRLVEDVFLPSGLELEAWSRAPYLCRGVRHRPVLILDDAIFRLRRRRD